MRNRLALPLVFAAVLTATVAHAAGVTDTRPTVCSATLNSSDEIELFKKNLGSNFRFIELTDYTDEKSKRPDAFLQAASEAGVTCDILVISGHFGGMFFGSSGYNLSMDTMERASCDLRCDGILKKPKEFFLFGCNTLAGKANDSRTPDEYRRVLMADGLSADDAERVVAYRYSTLGDSFSGRMRRVFSKTPRIYGFTSIGPSGKSIEGLLAPYLKQTGPRYSQMLSRIDRSVNKPLAKALRHAAFAQTMGEASPKIDKMMCWMIRPGLTPTEHI